MPRKISKEYAGTKLLRGTSCDSARNWNDSQGFLVQGIRANGDAAKNRLFDTGSKNFELPKMHT